MNDKIKPWRAPTTAAFSTELPIVTRTILAIPYVNRTIIVSKSALSGEVPPRWNANAKYDWLTKVAENDIPIMKAPNN